MDGLNKIVQIEKLTQKRDKNFESFMWFESSWLFTQKDLEEIHK